MEFEWDAQKAIKNIQKHGVHFTEAIETFYDPRGIQLFDKAHTNKEEIRYYWIDKSKVGRILTTYFTKRENVIRIIGSAEWRKFRRLYERTQIK